MLDCWLLTGWTGTVVLVAPSLRAEPAVLAGGGRAGLVRLVAVLPGPPDIALTPGRKQLEILQSVLGRK